MSKVFSNKERFTHQVDPLPNCYAGESMVFACTRFILLEIPLPAQQLGKGSG